MASQTLLSFLNRAKAATLTPSSAASGYPVANLQDPERPGLPWRSTVTTDTTIVIDHGAPVNVGRIVLLGANFASFKLQEHTADSWGSPTYDSGTQTIALDPDQRLYR